MAGTADVGDAIDLTFHTATAAAVVLLWLDPGDNTVINNAPVVENPAGSGAFPVTLVPNLPGIWTARFTASGAATAVETYYLRANPIDGPKPLATVGDVEDIFGTMSTAQQTLTAVLLRRASVMLRARYPDIDTRIATGALNSDLATQAAVNMALRVLRNPGGLRSESVGPFSRSFDTTYAAGMLVISPDEQNLVVPLVTPVKTIMVRPGLACWPRGVHRGL